MLSVSQTSTYHNDWFRFDEVETIDSPALVIYADRVKHNIQLLISSVADIGQLRPHVKTHKSIDICRMLLEMGIYKFKCATIAEAEMLAMAGAKDILLAYQPVGPKALRFAALIKAYPGSHFSCLVDHPRAAQQLSEIAKAHHLEITVYLDLNVGMNRTGISCDEKALSLCKKLQQLPHLYLAGLHAYDGHVEEPDLAKRTAICQGILAQVNFVKSWLLTQGLKPQVVMGGSPTFPVYAKYEDLECSPGTFLFWDESYSGSVPDLQFLPAALILGRIISFPGDRIAVDIGHKAIAAEYPLPLRARLLNAPGLQIAGHSEEHLILSGTTDKWQIGDVIYALPMHICPTVALHQYAVVVEDHEIVATWEITARNRRLSI